MGPGGFLDRLAPRALGMEDKAFPRVADRAATSILPSVNPARSGRAKMRAAYFVGCGTNLVYPQVAVAAVNVMTRNDIEVIIPPGQVCCGIPVYSSGDFRNARRLAITNREVFRDIQADCVVTDCASCSAALKHDLAELVGIEVSPVPVYDLTEFLAGRIELKREFAPLDLTVTYHDACHLARGQGIRNEPRELIRMVPGIRFIEMEGADDCCGGAGTFAYTHHGLSRRVGAKKAGHIRNTGAGLVAAACPSCTMQIADLLAHEGIGAAIAHPVELLDRSCREKDRRERERNQSSGEHRPEQRGVYA
jgi:glycolate oxidase iron-sulfur subunit